MATTIASDNVAEQLLAEAADYQMLARGELQSVRVCCRLRFLLADLERLIDRGRESNPALEMREPGSLSGLKGSRENDHGECSRPARPH
jgi:hypothetical protein